MTKVTAVAAGDEYSLALLSDGTVMAWGDDEHGQLGDGKTANSDVPVAVKGVTGATAVSAGGEHSLALLGNGTVIAWGDDDYGQLGDSAVTNEEEAFSDAPVAVLGVSSVKAVAAGGEHSLALLGDGTVMAWGEDEYGQLGDGGIALYEETPVPVSGLSGVAAISAGGEHSMALLDGGSVVAWRRWARRARRRQRRRTERRPCRGQRVERGDGHLGQADFTTSPTAKRSPASPG